MNKALHFIPIRRLVTLFATVFFFTHSVAQVKFYTVCNSNKIGKNDYLQVQFTVENAASVQSIIPPTFRDFDVISGPNEESSMINDNGKVKQTVSVGYVLKPLSTGNFTIGVAKAKVDGTEYHSSPVTIEVNNSASSNSSSNSPNSLSSPFGNLTLDFPTGAARHQFDDYILQKGENVQEKIKKNLFVRIDVNKTSCYVGEPIVVTYKLYTRLKSESNVVKTPSFNGFSVSELEVPDNFSVSNEKYNGRDYNVYILRKVQLYPLQPGNLTLEPLQVDNKITFIKSEFASRKGDINYDLMRDFADETAPGNATQVQSASVTCEPVNINVRPLPEGKPSSFKGAVGDFKITGSLEKNNITTDDAGNLRIIISGSGNFPMINSPNVPWPQNIEGFDPKSSENVDKLSVPMRGEKIFNYPFTATKSGLYEIPSVEFSYFDPVTQSYKTIGTPSLSINIDRGTGQLSTVASETKKGNENLFETLYNYRWYLVGGVILICALSIFLIRRKKQRVENIKTPVAEDKISELIQKTEFSFTADPLAATEEKLHQNDPGQFYKTLDESIKKYLSKKLKVPEEEITRKKVNELMDKCNVGVGTTILLNSLMEDIELNLYAPVTNTKMQEDYEKASEVIALLDKQIS